MEIRTAAAIAWRAIRRDFARTPGASARPLDSAVLPIPAGPSERGIRRSRDPANPDPVIISSPRMPKKVLLIDYEPRSVDRVRSLLDGSEYGITVAKDGEEGLSVFASATFD